MTAALLNTKEIMMSIERKHVGPRMSQIAIHGKTVYLAGVVATATEGVSTAAQTTDILDQIDKLLAEAGTDKSNVYKATIWLRDIATFAEMNSVWDKWVVPGKTPVRATVEARLAAPSILVEIQVEAALD
tara:strand:- start:3473 stop:3862 length:390 start_codon:yes stop_codon:yes gene_type:complete